MVLLSKSSGLSSLDQDFQLPRWAGGWSFCESISPLCGTEKPVMLRQRYGWTEEPKPLVASCPAPSFFIFETNEGPLFVLGL